MFQISKFPDIQNLGSLFFPGPKGLILMAHSDLRNFKVPVLAQFFPYSVSSKVKKTLDHFFRPLDCQEPKFLGSGFSWLAIWFRFFLAQLYLVSNILKKFTHENHGSVIFCFQLPTFSSNFKTLAHLILGSEKFPTRFHLKARKKFTNLNPGSEIFLPDFSSNFKTLAHFFSH